ncbi:MAG TPA: hypothetical protein V6C81_17325 [Planktothrix sp.]
MINNGSGRDFEGVRLARIGAIFGICSLLAASSPLMQSSAWAAKPVDSKSADKKADKKGDSKSDKKSEAKTPEPVIENVIDVTTDELVDKPHEYLNKNVRFKALFHAFSSLALDYKPAMRSSKNYLSFLVFRPNGSKVPYSELKLAMATPKEKDPENQLLISLKENDELEITGHVFGTALDEPWVDVLKLKRLSQAPEKEKTAEESGNKEKKAGDTEPEVKGDKK